ncbi:hypothetical protein [Staphylococcus aureus]|uniref:hypothetical protein n=1 Tax=Staphylococcus aureus TaxID=1280 RepID=UPI003D2FFE8A
MFDEFGVVSDTLFHTGIRRTDIYQGYHETSVNSTEYTSFTTDRRVTFSPGHGTSTTVAHEYTTPFLDGKS